MSINRVNITGNLTRDSELRTTPSGSSVLNFSIAVNESRRNQNGEWEDYANFVDCTLFGKRATALHSRLVKGVHVAIDGKLHYSSWEDNQTGKKRSKLDVTIDNIELSPNKQPEQRQSQDTYEEAYDDNGIPF